jgi:hypothetical protein
VVRFVAGSTQVRAIIFGPSLSETGAADPVGQHPAAPGNSGHFTWAVKDSVDNILNAAPVNQPQDRRGARPRHAADASSGAFITFLRWSLAIVNRSIPRSRAAVSVQALRSGIIDDD